MEKRARAQCPFCYDGYIVRQGKVFHCNRCHKQVWIESMDT